jgi:hypothetical protein
MCIADVANRTPTENPVSSAPPGWDCDATAAVGCSILLRGGFLRIRRTALLFVLAALAATFATDVAATASRNDLVPIDVPFEHVRDVPLGPKLDRFDYQRFDPASGRLFVGAMRAGNQLRVYLGWQVAS